MEFQCSVCGYSSSFKSNITKHINRKKKCGENPSVKEIPVEITCQFCDKHYKTKDNLMQHVKGCKIRKNNFEEEITKLRKENQELKRQQQQSINSHNTTNITNNTTNNNTTNNYIIQLRPYNDPRLPDDMDDIYEDGWEQKRPVQTYIERIHFNIELPENHNMCITNLQSKLAAKVFTGQGWESRDQNKTLDEIIAYAETDTYKWVRANKKRKEKYETSFMEYVGSIGKKEVDKETKTDLRALLYDSHKNGMVDIKSTSKKAFDDCESDV